MSEILGSKHECAYCGWTGDTRDHVPALSIYWLGNRKRANSSIPVNKKKVIPACKECNGILSNFFINSIRERAEYLSDALERKYNKLLNQPFWTEEEIDKMGDSMKHFIKAKAIKRQIVVGRLTHLGQISRFGSITPEEYWSKVG